jgi:hypothetical protein
MKRNSKAPVATIRSVAFIAPIALIVLIALIALPLALLSLLPTLLGREPAVTVSPVDQAVCILCAQDSSGPAGILVGGDSRALYHVIPSELDSATGRKTVNVAQWLHFGGDPITLVNVLRRYPQVMAAKPAIVMSVTLDGLNDLGFKGMPMATMMNWGPIDHFRAALHRPRAYPKYFATAIAPAIAKMILHRLKGERFVCDGNIYRPPRLEADRGFEAYEGRKTEGFWSLPGNEKDYLLEGGNLKALRKALAWLAASQAERIVVFNAPIDTAWLARTDGPVAMAMEARFSDLMAREIARYPRIEYLDFHRHPLPELQDRHFYDQTHLNHEGAILFSRHLGARLAHK